MIAKLPKKDIFSLAYITVLTVGALVHGFTSIPSPADQRAKNFDDQRVNALKEIRYSIDNYYEAHGFLPPSLDDITTSVYTYEKLKKVDPETNKPYEYKINNDQPPTYSLCANFSTNSADADRYSNTNLLTYDSEFAHNKGYFCFTLEPNYNQYYDSEPKDSPPDMKVLPTIWDYQSSSSADVYYPQ